MSVRMSSMLRLAGAAMMALAMLPWLAAWLPGLFGLMAVSVPTGSMSPSVPAGSMVYVSREAPAEGDVAAFWAMDGRTLVLHRVLDIGNDGTMLTKGDANPVPDTARVPCGNAVGRMAASVPFLGALAETVRTPCGRIGALMGAGCGLMLVIMSGCRRRKRY